MAESVFVVFVDWLNAIKEPLTDVARIPLARLRERVPGRAGEGALAARQQTTCQRSTLPFASENRRRCRRHTLSRPFGAPSPAKRARGIRARRGEFAPRRRAFLTLGRKCPVWRNQAFWFWTSPVRFRTRHCVVLSQTPCGSQPDACGSKPDRVRFRTRPLEVRNHTRDVWNQKA
jgi:hypothetical protein